MNKNLIPVRVYALCVHPNGYLLTLKEKVGEEIVVKFPGGGLEADESPFNCLERELKEELTVEYEKAELFYTPDIPIYNYFKPGEQVLPLYFKVYLKSHSVPQIRERKILEMKWYAFSELPIDQFNFTSDKKAVEVFSQCLISN